MSEFPWFPLYPDDFHSSRKTKTMDATQVGVYMLLLMDEWRNGPLPDDDIELALVGRETCGQVRDVLTKCFKKSRDGWINVKLEAVRTEQQEKRDKRVSAGQKGGYAKASKDESWQSSSNATAMPQQCPSIQKQKQIQKKRGSFPQGWEPQLNHHARAKEEGVDVRIEAEKFENYAISNSKTYSDWDRAFTNWLIRAGEYKAPAVRATTYDDPARQRL